MRRIALIAATLLIAASGCAEADDTAATNDVDDAVAQEEPAELSATATTAGDVTWTFDSVLVDPDTGEMRVRASHNAPEGCDVGYTLTVLDDDGGVVAAGAGMASAGEGETVTDHITLDVAPIDPDEAAALDADTDMNACASDADDL